MPIVRTILTAIRVSDLPASLGFYVALGYVEVGRVQLDNDAELVMLKFAGEEFVSLELQHRPDEGELAIGDGLHHIAIQVDDLGATIAALRQSGLEPGPVGNPGGPDGARTAWLQDPDGYRIELVQWPDGHPIGLTEADFR